MSNDVKNALRRLLLEKRDNTSGDLLEIAAKKIQKKLWKIKSYSNARRVGAYYSVGSEIPTHNIIQELLSKGKKVHLPKVTGDSMEFHEITDFSSLECGSFDIMEPKNRCPVENRLDVIIVPAVCMSTDGRRVGYGRGFYDRFLEKNKTVTIAPVLEKQIVRNIPQSRLDHSIDWIVTEDGMYDTRRLQ